MGLTTDTDLQGYIEILKEDNKQLNEKFNKCQNVLQQLRHRIDFTHVDEIDALIDSVLELKQ